jgi:hypothetical protein
MSGSGTGTIASVSEEAYVLVSDANIYFAGDPRATAFLALTTAEKIWYLKRATKTIDGLPLRGRKYLRDGTQARQFPREYREGYDMNESTGLAEVPQAIEDACCEEALALYLFYADTDRSERKTMKEDGVKSYSLGGDYSENLGGSNSDKHNGLLSSEAYNLLSKHIARSFPIV